VSEIEISDLVRYRASAAVIWLKTILMSQSLLICM